MTGVTLYNGLPRSVVTFVTVDNRLPYAFVQIILLQQGYCTFVIIRFGPFTRLFINLAMRMRALFPKFATALGLVEQAFWRVDTFYRMNWCKFLWGNPCRAIETFYHWDAFPLGLRVLDAFLSFRCMKEFGDEFGCDIFARLLKSWRKLQLSPLEHCPLASHCQQSPRILCPRCFVPWILDHGVSFIISVPGAKIPISCFLLDISFYHCLQSV